MKNYLLYMYRGQLKVTEIIWQNGCRKAADPSKWHAKVNPIPLKFTYGKIWCHEDDLDKAIGMMKEHYKEYAEGMEKLAAKITEYKNGLCKEEGD